MNARRVDYIFDLFAKFTHLRTKGANRDDAWQKVMAMDAGLNEEDIQALLKLAKDWEKREGYKYHYRSEDDSPTQTMNPIRKIRPASESSAIRPLPSVSTRQGLTGTLTMDTLRSQDQLRLEQILDQATTFSIEEPPMPEGGTVPLQAIQPLVEPTKLPTFFGERTLLLMYFKALREPLTVRLRGDEEIIIGRSTENSSMAPDVDLDVVRAGEYGVSRMHAALKRDNNQLLITDLGSMNHTQINGKRLFPEEIRVLQHRDEIWFGRLLCRIHFYHQN